MADDQHNPPPSGQEPYDNGYGNGNGEQKLNTSSAPAVAASPTRVLMALVLIVGAVAFVLYSFLSDDNTTKKDDDEKPKKIATTAIEPPPPPPLPPPEPPVITQPPPPPAIPEPPPFNIPPDVGDDGGGIFGGGRGASGGGNGPPAMTDEQRLQRLKSPMLVVGSEGGFDTSDADRARAEESLAGSDPNLAFSRDAIAASDTKKAIATSIGNLRATIAQGKVIEAVLETAINTDLPGTLRAIVSHDVYPEAGNDPMIPKGARLIGAYNTGILRGQKRVFIIWTRMIRPDGVDIKLGSPGVDALGRAGVAGYVDNKFTEQFSTALLTSAFSIGVAIAGEGITGGDEVTTTTTPEGGSTTSGSAGAIATAEAVKNIGDVGKSIVEKTLDLRPTITVRQGTKISVMVNRDLIFPAETTTQARFVE